MIDTLDELMEYLDMRGAKYGIDGSEILDEIPQSVRKPEMAYQYMQLKDISHIDPLSQGGDPAGDNWYLEDSSVNRSRGAETATEAEQDTAKADGEWDASQIRKIATRAGLYVGASAAAEAALGAATGAAVAAAEGALIASVATTVATVALVAGCTVGTVQVIRTAHKRNWLSKVQQAFS